MVLVDQNVLADFDSALSEVTSPQFSEETDASASIESFQDEQAAQAPARPTTLSDDSDFKDDDPTPSTALDASDSQHSEAEPSLVISSSIDHAMTPLQGTQDASRFIDHDPLHAVLASPESQASPHLDAIVIEQDSVGQVQESISIAVQIENGAPQQKAPTAEPLAVSATLPLVESSTPQEVSESRSVPHQNQADARSSESEVGRETATETSSLEAQAVVLASSTPVEHSHTDEAAHFEDQTVSSSTSQLAFSEADASAPPSTCSEALLIPIAGSSSVALTSFQGLELLAPQQHSESVPLRPEEALQSVLREETSSFTVLHDTLSLKPHSEGVLSYVVTFLLGLMFILISIASEAVTKVRSGKGAAVASHPLAPLHQPLL